MPNTDLNEYTEQQLLKNSATFLQSEFHRYKRCKMLLNVIEECSQESNFLDSGLKKKIKNIILNGHASQIRLGNSYMDKFLQPLLGVSLELSDLTYAESDLLQHALMSKLNQKSEELKSERIKYFEKKITASKDNELFDIDTDDAALLNFKRQLLEEQQLCLEQYNKLLKLLDELKKLVLEVVPEETQKKIQECELTLRVNSLKSQLAKSKCRIDTFMESSNSLEAYTVIIKDLKDQQKECITEIEMLKDLSQKYVQVSCKEYNELLKMYLQYKSVLEKREQLSSQV